MNNYDWCLIKKKQAFKEMLLVLKNGAVKLVML